MASNAETSAARQFYRDAPRPKSAREECEEGDEAAEVLRDEAAEKLRAAGCPAREAHRYVEGVLAVLRARDERLARECGGAGAEGLVALPEVLEALRVMAIKLVQARQPKFEAGCFLLAAGFEYAGVPSQRKWAEALGLSPEHASNAVREWQRIFKLGRTSGQKSERALASYKITNGRRAT